MITICKFRQNNLGRNLNPPCAIPVTRSAARRAGR
jgi:hypothetical protein